jgi:hypothetical protein
MTDIDLNAIQERADAATAAPWIEWHSNMNDENDNPIPDDQMDPEDYEEFYCPPATGAFLIAAHSRPEQEANADFIAHAREDIPALLAEVAKLTEERDTARAERDDFETLAMVNRMNVSDYMGAIEDAKAAREERDGLAAVIAEVRGIGAKSGTDLNAWNKAFDVMDATPAATLAARDAEKKAEGRAEAVRAVLAAVPTLNDIGYERDFFADVIREIDRTSQQGEPG